MDSPFTGSKMVLANLPNSPMRDKYYKCPDTKALFLIPNITKEELRQGYELGLKLLERIKA